MSYVKEQAEIARRRDRGHPQFWGRIAGTSSDVESAEWLLKKYQWVTEQRPGNRALCERETALIVSIVMICVGAGYCASEWPTSSWWSRATPRLPGAVGR